MKVVLIHGKDTDPNQKWYPWFREEVEKMGYEFVAPVLPKAADPVMDEWLAEIDKTTPDEETVLVGHSRGGVAILRWLEKLEPKKQVRKVILVATNSGRLKDKAIPGESNYGFYTEEGYDFEKIRTHCNDFVVLHSRDDKWVPFSAGETNAAGLSAKFLQFDDCGHFGKGVSEIPELLEETIKYDARKALIVPINSKRQIFIQDRRGHKKPDWGYFGGEIEQDETPLEAVIRESEEELDVNIKPEELKYMGISTTLWNEHKIIRYMHLYPTEQESFNVLEGKGGHWLSFEEVRERLDDKDRFDEIVKRIEKIWPLRITYFVHGTTTDNEAGISSGWKDVELSELGVKQSKELTEKTKDKHFDVIFCSDLKRAVDSANLTWGETHKIIQDERLRECNYGDYNGKPSDVVEPLQEKSITEPLPNGESYEMVKERVASFLEDLKKNYDGKSVAIVAHKAPQLVLDVILKDKTWEEAFAKDWRKTKSWQPGWEYELK